MSFGRKGLAGAQPVQAQSGGFGRAAATGTLPRPDEPADADDIAARRAAFIAAERLRRPDTIEEGSLPSPEAMASLHNSRFASSGPARPAQKLGGGPIGETGLPAGQEEQIRAAAQQMNSRARSAPAPAPARAGGDNPWAGKKLLFGDPRKRHLGVAYVLWYFGSMLGIHRVYCGHLESGMCQVALLVVSLIIAAIFPPLAVIGFAAWVCWIIGDLFMMPSMMRKFKEAHDYQPDVFA